MTLVSLIITTHQRPHFLRRAIKSARRAGSNIEIVVVDDASSDETAEACADFDDIRYVRAERNQRVAGARNLGILASSGEYLAFLDDDDIRLPTSLDAQLELLASHPEAGLVYGQALIGDQWGTLTGSSYPARCPQGDVLWELLSRNFIPSGTAVFRRSCIFKVGLFDERIPGLDDWDLWIRIAELYSVVALERPVMIWRQSTPFSGQGTSRAAELAALSTNQFLQRWMRLPRAVEAAQADRRRVWHEFSRHMASHLFWQSVRAAGLGGYGRAIKNLIALLRWHPVGACRLACDRVALRYLAASIADHSRARRVVQLFAKEAPERKG